MTRFTLSAAALALTFAAASHADVILSDGTFSSGNWGLETFTANGSGGSVIASQLTNGGNPGQARSVTNTTGSGPNNTIYGLHRFGTTTTTRYEPGTQGAIASVNFSIDFAFISGAGGQGHGLMLGAKQGTIVFGAAATVTGSSSAWSNYNVTGLTAADFTAVSGSGNIDFTASGAPIRFGFITSNSNGSGGTSYFNQIAYDNFNVRIIQVPTPGIAPLTGLAAVALTKRRRK